ncbi:MAG: endonuclease Q family protein, partial [Candidatus Aenigmarchaeota archaeon]|nr:endonuclease Q family protein [Candidatus Aenigmarchaeota archaeon]
LIYSQGGRGRRVHHCLLAENFAVVDQINEWLSKKGRRDYDGRPIFGFSSVEFAEAMMSISKDIEIIPAHAWTPWFGILGSMSGFNSIEECFQDQSKHIHAIETGLSSDPPMNWRLSSLDKYTLVSNSDSHSPYPWRLGREINVFDLKEITYNNIINAIRTRKNFLFTVEVSPSYGKYHFDGHRICNISMSPDESAKHNNTCPRCNKELTIGVLHRVEELADRQEGYKPADAVPYKSLIPLSEIIACITGTDVFTKRVWEIYNPLIAKFGNEFNVLLNAELNELKKVVNEKLAELIIKNRQGKIKIIPGYDGVYGKPVLESKKEESLRGFLK